MPGSPLELLREKLDFLRREEVLAVDDEQKFKLRKDIEEIEARLQQLEQEGRPRRTGWIAAALAAVALLAVAAVTLRPAPEPAEEVPAVNVLVQSASDQPLDGARVWAVLPGGGTRDAEDGKASGLYVFPSLPGGPVEIHATKGGYKKAWEKGVQIEPGMTQVTLVLGEG